MKSVMKIFFLGGGGGGHYEIGQFLRGGGGGARGLFLYIYGF